MEGSSNISFNVDRIYNVKVKGILNMHGISNEVTTNAVITIRQGVISGEANFTISLSDYKIKIPSIVATNVSNQISLQVTIPAFQSL
jgi:polyisoprenoid-binding protein YceI